MKKDDYRKEFLKLFKDLTYSRSGWQVWEDVITMMACSISNVLDRRPEVFERREKDFERCRKNCNGVEIPAKMLALVTESLEVEPEQDFLGDIYMDLDLGSHWKGQFFTPYNLCTAMSEMTMEKDMVRKAVEKNGYVTINDPSCGAGATLIGAVNTLRRQGINHQVNALFIANDIDPVVAKMCYIQLSLLGCAGYVAVADTLCNPLTGHPLFPDQKKYQDFWFTPMWFSDVWQTRRLIKRMQFLTAPMIEEKRHFFVFDFKEVLDGRGQEEVSCG